MEHILLYLLIYQLNQLILNQLFIVGKINIVLDPFILIVEDILLKIFLFEQQIDVINVYFLNLEQEFIQSFMCMNQ